MVRPFLPGLAGALVCLVMFPVRGDDLDSAPVPRPLREDAPPSYMGKVTAVTGEMVTIKPEGDLKMTYKHYGPNGATKTWEYVQDNTKPPRTFVFDDELLFHNGTLPVARRAKLSVGCPIGQHKISDLQVGDLVWIGCDRVRGVDYCTNLEILRRPGGRVPFAIGDEKRKPGERKADGLNAAQWIEETLIPGVRDAKIFPNR